MKRTDAILLAGATFGSAAILAVAVLSSLTGSLRPDVGVAALVVGAAAGLLAFRDARGARGAGGRA